MRRLLLGAFIWGLKAQVLVWQETFDGPSASLWVTESSPGSKTNPTPSGIAGLTYVTNQPGNNYFVINDANTPELDGTGNFVRGRRAECGPPNDLPNPYTNGGLVNRSLHITAKVGSDGDALGYINYPDYGDEYSWSNQGFGLDGNSDQYAYYNADINTVGRTCLRLVADFYLGGDRDRVRSYASILYSIDGGTTWQVLVPNIQASINALLWPAYHFVAGTCNNWTRLTFPLPADAENISNLRIAFRWRNDNSDPMTTADYTIGAGFNVDNIRLEAAAPPTANFTPSATTVCKNQIVTLTNQTQIPCNLPTTYTWSISPSTFNFVGGTNANSTNPQVKFTATGTYTISLTATNTAGSHTQTYSDLITVTSCPPVAKFSMNVNAVCALSPTPPTGAPTSVTLTDISDLRYQSFVSRTWTITPSTGVSISPSATASPVTITFNNPGTYSVQLTVTNTDGTDDTLAVGVINVAACPCGGSSATMDTVVFYTQDFDGCTYSPDLATTPSCGFTNQNLTAYPGNSSFFGFYNSWHISGYEVGVTPTISDLSSCGYSGDLDQSLYMGAFGTGYLGYGAAYLDDNLGWLGAAHTHKRAVSPNINTIATPSVTQLYVEFDMIAKGDPGEDYAYLQYSTDGGSTWINPSAPYNTLTVVIGPAMLSNLTSEMRTDNSACDPQGRWIRVRWQAPPAAIGIPNLRIGFVWRNVADNIGTDPSIAVDDIKVYGIRPGSAFTANTYTGPNGGSWHVASNWSANNIPDLNTEDAQIPAGKHVVITNGAATNVRHVCNYGKIEFQNPPTTQLRIHGNLLNMGEITSNNTDATPDIAFYGTDSRYRGTGTNWDVDYAVSSGKTTLESDLSCRSLRISSDFDMTGRKVTVYKNLNYTGGGTITHTGSTVILNGPCTSCVDNTNNQMVVSGAVTFNLHNLVIDKSAGTVTQTAGDIRINGTMTIIQGIYDALTNRLRDGASVSAPLVMQGGELRLADITAGRILPELSGTYTLTGGKVTLYGTGGQTLRGARGYYDLRFEGSGVKKLQSTDTVKSQLELAVNGYVDALTNSSYLYVSNPSVSAVTRTNGHVVGYLVREINPSGLGTYRFDVGSPALYERFEIQIRDPLGGAHKLAARFIDTDPTDPSPAVAEGTATWNVALAPGYWHVCPLGALPPPYPPCMTAIGIPIGEVWKYDAISYPQGFTLPSNPAQYTLGKRADGNGPDWSPTLTGIFQLPAGGTVRRNLFSDFSEFGILTSPTPLPRMRIDLAGQWQEEKIVLRWKPEGIVNTSIYEVQHLHEGQWRAVGTTAGHSWLDVPQAPHVLYRVVGRLLEGGEVISNTVELWRGQEGMSLQVFPNPGSEAFYFEGSVAFALEVEIYDSQGRLVERLSSAEGQAVWRPSGTVAEGMYFYKASYAGTSYTGKLLLRR
ncbi:MAG: PKD domain-containing protein [Bacteroidia bacterium]